jgi:hypothetical protein
VSVFRTFAHVRSSSGLINKHNMDRISEKDQTKGMDKRCERPQALLCALLRVHTARMVARVIVSADLDIHIIRCENELKQKLLVLSVKTRRDQHEHRDVRKTLGAHATISRGRLSCVASSTDHIDEVGIPLNRRAQTQERQVSTRSCAHSKVVSRKEY